MTAFLHDLPFGGLVQQSMAAPAPTCTSTSTTLTNSTTRAPVRIYRFGGDLPGSRSFASIRQFGPFGDESISQSVDIVRHSGRADQLPLATTR